MKKVSKGTVLTSIPSHSIPFETFLPTHLTYFERAFNPASAPAKLAVSSATAAEAASRQVFWHLPRGSSLPSQQSAKISSREYLIACHGKEVKTGCSAIDALRQETETYRTRRHQRRKNSVSRAQNPSLGNRNCHWGRLACL